MARTSRKRTSRKRKSRKRTSRKRTSRRLVSRRKKQYKINDPFPHIGGPASDTYMGGGGGLSGGAAAALVASAPSRRAGRHHIARDPRSAAERESMIRNAERQVVMDPRAVWPRTELLRAPKGPTFRLSELIEMISHPACGSLQPRWEPRTKVIHDFIQNEKERLGITDIGPMLNSVYIGHVPGPGHTRYATTPLIASLLRGDEELISLLLLENAEPYKGVAEIDKCPLALPGRPGYTWGGGRFPIHESGDFFRKPIGYDDTPLSVTRARGDRVRGCYPLSIYYRKLLDTVGNRRLYHDLRKELDISRRLCEKGATMRSPEDIKRRLKDLNRELGYPRGGLSPQVRGTHKSASRSALTNRPGGPQLDFWIKKLTEHGQEGLPDEIRQLIFSYIFTKNRDPILPITNDWVPRGLPQWKPHGGIPHARGRPTDTYLHIMPVPPS